MGGVLAGTQTHSYGTALFTAVPFITAFIGAWVDTLPCRRSLGQCCISGMLPLALGSVMFLVLGIEGLIFIVMAGVLSLPLAFLGAALAYAVQRHRVAPLGTAAMAIFAPLAIFIGPHGPAHDIDTATTSIVINAAPEVVWPHVQAFGEIEPPDNILFRSGVAYPVATRIEGQGIGALRQCILSTGTMTERVTDWEPARRLTFDVLTTPVAMKELSPWPNLDLPHLHGFYISRRGEFRLTPLPGGRTLVEGQSWYQHGLAPVAYWNLWTRYVVHNVHRRVLRHIKMLAEADAGNVEVAMRH